MNSPVRTAVVTGGGHGIGRALCRRLQRDGATVVVVDLDGVAAENVAVEIGGVARVVDVADETAMLALVDEVERDIGPIDLFVSNAGCIWRWCKRLDIRGGWP